MHRGPHQWMNADNNISLSCLMNRSFTNWFPLTSAIITQMWWRVNFAACTCIRPKSFLTDKDWEWGEEEVGRQEGFRASVLTWLRSSSSRPAVVVIIIPSYHRPDSSLLVTVPLLWSMDDGNLRLTVGCYQWLQYSSHSFIIWDNEPLFPPLTVRLRSTLLVCFLPLFSPSSHNCTVLSPPKPSPFVADFPPQPQSYLFNWISKRAL